MIKIDSMKNISNSVLKSSCQNVTKQINFKQNIYKNVEVKNNGDTFTKTVEKENGTIRTSKFNSAYLATHNPKDRYPINIVLKNYCGTIQECHISPERHSIAISVGGETYLKDTLKNGKVIYRVNGASVFNNIMVEAKSKLAAKVDSEFRELYKYVAAGHPKLLV